MLKQKLQLSLGAIGGIVFHLITLTVYVLPIVMINTSFWWDALFFVILYIFPVTSVIFWIWGLVCAITGPQDIFAIIYYVLFVVLWIPFFVSVIKDLVFRRSDT